MFEEFIRESGSGLLISSIPETPTTADTPETPIEKIIIFNLVCFIVIFGFIYYTCFGPGAPPSTRKLFPQDLQGSGKPAPRQRVEWRLCPKIFNNLLVSLRSSVMPKKRGGESGTFPPLVIQNYFKKPPILAPRDRTALTMV